MSCRTLSEEVHVQVKTKVLELDQLKEDLFENFRQWRPTRKRTREKLEELASKLQEQHIRGSKSTIVGASAGTVGGILAIAGLITAPFTFGAGFVVSLFGAGIGGVGGLVMSIAKVIEMALEKLKLKEVQKAIDEDREVCTQLQEKLANLDKIISDLRGIEGNGFEFIYNEATRGFTTSNEKKTDFPFRFFRVFASVASVGAEAAAAAGAFARAGVFARAGGSAGVRAANLAGGVVGAVLLPLDIYMLVKSL